MAKIGKKYKKAFSQIDRLKEYAPADAIKLVKQVAFSKMAESVDVAINLGVDPRQADQNIRGATVLPHGLGKTVRIIVFAKGEKATEAAKLGVEAVGGDDLAKRITDEGWMEFDQVIATPDMMGVVGKLGKVLGPRGLMPNPKVGTVTFDITKAVTELKAGRAEYRVDKNGIVHTSIGRLSFGEKQIEDNLTALMEALQKVKPSTSKGTYLKKITMSSTMGPGVKVDPTPFRA
jgi:large subunit ribosomal protein L1